MKRLMNFRILAVLVWVLSLLAACSPQPAAAPTAQSAVTAKVKVRIAALPIIDALPLYVAQQEGLFAKENVDVEFIPAGLAVERDQLIAARQADGMINDLVSVALYNKDSTQVVAVRTMRVPDEKNAMYRVLAAKNSGIKEVKDLAGVPVGMSQGTIIDYVTTRMLEKKGLTADQIKSVAVPKMDQRLALLQSGELKAATLPEPFATLAMQSGAILVVDDTQDPDFSTFSNSVVSFRKEFIDQHPDVVKAFLRAVDQAAADINQNGEKYRTLLGSNKLVPAAAQATFPIPAFITGAWPTRSTFEDAVAWAKGRKLITRDVSYDTSVSGNYLAP